MISPEITAAGSLDDEIAEDDLTVKRHVDAIERRLIRRAVDQADGNHGTPGDTVARVEGIVGAGAALFDGSTDAFVKLIYPVGKSRQPLMTCCVHNASKISFCLEYGQLLQKPQGIYMKREEQGAVVWLGIFP